MKNKYAYAACFAATLSFLTACGDDVTEVTNVNESTGIEQVDKYKKLPKCDDENEGSLVFVKDSAKVYVCADESWMQLNGKDGKDGKDGESGKDGKDGKDGKNGADGKDGNGGSSSACEVTKTDSGDFDVTCSGKSVGTIKNGADGKDGQSCTAKENKEKNGFDIVCGGDVIGTIKNGADGKDGSNGDDGNACSFTEGENGEVTLTCGEKSTTLFKAVCGTGSYDPATQICGYTYDEDDNYISGVPEPQCKDWSEIYSWAEGQDYSTWTYSVRDMFCDEKGVMHKMCEWEDDDGKIVRKSYAWDEYCDAENKKIAKKIPCAEGSKDMRKPTEYCYTTNDNSKVRTAELLVCGSGNSAKEYSPVTHFCKKSTGVLGEKKICAKNPNKADPLNIDIRYMAETNMDDQTSELCDTRDYQIYATQTLENGHTWMVDNLRYAYKGKTSSLDSSSFCYNDMYDGKGGTCDKKGRFYFWSAVVDSAELKKSDIYCGYDEFESCKLPETVRGICPEGWHVPSADEAEEGLDNKSPEYVSVSLEQFENGTLNWATAWSGYWTSTDASETGARRMDPVYGLKTNEKHVAFFLRCIKDYEKEEPAETTKD